MGTKISRRKSWESQANYLARKVKALQQDNEELMKARSYLLSEIQNEIAKARDERQKALDVERGAMQEHLTRLRIVNQKILMEARKAVASVVLVSPTERTKADETELKCMIQVIEAWATEQEFKLAALARPKSSEDQCWGTSIVDLKSSKALSELIKKGFAQEYPTDLDGASIIKERQDFQKERQDFHDKMDRARALRDVVSRKDFASLATGRAIHREIFAHPGKVTSDVIAKVVKKHIARKKGGEKK